MQAHDILPGHQNQVELNGVVIRKGSVGAFLANATAWLDTHSTAAQRAEAERDMIAALPALRALGLFNILQIKDDALQQLLQAH